MRKIICNPVNMNAANMVDTAGREAGFGFGSRMAVPHGGFGDPAVVRFKNRYYVFGSMHGFWWSDDLCTWNPGPAGDLGTMPGAAGDGCVIGDYLVQSASSRDHSWFTRSKDPMHEKFETCSDPGFGFWDPALFRDDDGRVYLYWGCHNVTPIWGIEMDPETLMPIGERAVLISMDYQHHGFERNGWNNDMNVGFLRVGETDAPGLDYPAPWIEGSYMTKHDGKYYLQYAAPATELQIYSDGYYVSDKPLGPYTYAENSPFSTVRGGFYQGAGHGSTFQDAYGNYWHAASMIGCAPFSSRKMGLFPVGFDQDGVMYCDQRYPDYPHVIPEEAADPNSTFTGWMLLSYKKPARASSAIDGHGPEFLTDESSRSCFVASRRRPGEFVVLDLESVDDVRAIQLNFCDWERNELLGIPFHHFSMLPENERYIRHRWLLEGSKDGETWEVLCDKREAMTNMAHDLIVFEEGKRVRYLRLTSTEMPFFGSFAMTGLRVFGHRDGSAPAKAEKVAIERDPQDGCTVNIHWAESDGADGYNVLWGIAPDKLYHATLVYGKQELLMHCLNDGVPYYIRVDAFNGSGITEGKVQAAQ